MVEPYLFDGPQDADATIIFAHGAGAPMDTPFMSFFAEALAALGFRVVRFEFPYMRRRRLEGTRTPPNTAKKLIVSWQETIAAQKRDGLLLLAGKSMGGRYATMIADDVHADGVICLGYPFHPPGKPEKLRTAHLEVLKTPCLILQGTRDPFGKPEEVEAYPLSQAVEVFWLPDGDHSLKPRKSSGFTEAAHWQRSVTKMQSFIEKLK